MISLRDNPSKENALGDFLKTCRAKHDPAAFGFSTARRRTPGLRREEVAQLACVSATWYTWLEQGRGGTPSADVLEGIAQGLSLSPAEREHLFMLAQGRPPERRTVPAGGVSPGLQKVLDAMEISPAYIKDSMWNVLAWNRAAAKVLGDYGQIPVDQRNILQLLFCNPEVRKRMPNWQDTVRFMVAAFRADATRTGSPAKVRALVKKLSRESEEFEVLWLRNEVVNFGHGQKVICHETAGPIALEYSAFSLDGQPDLGLVIFTAATPADADQIRALVEQTD